MIAAQSGVPGNVEDGSVVMGSPAFDNKEYKKSYIGFRKLPQLRDKVRELEKKIEELTKANQ
jgi:UDP-3-O-[3-hydroxymyristoyl] glucosamine N-acyltransferase